MLKLIGENGAMVALLSQLMDFTIESDLVTADKLIHFLLPKSVIPRASMQQELYLQSSTDEYVIKEINYSDEDFYEVFGKLNLDSLHGKAYLTIEIESGNLDAALTSVLAGTGWTYQIVDANTKLRTIKLTNVSVYQIVLECCAVYGCEVWFDTLGKTARFYTKRGMDRGAYVYSELNLKDRDYQSDTYDLATRLYPIGKDGLTIASVNDGQEYIDNHQFTSKIIERKWIDERYTNAQALYDDAVAVLDVLSKPRVSFRMDVLNLIGSRSEYAILDFQLGDNVRIIDKANQFADMQRIVHLIEYPLMPEKNKVDFSNSPIKYSGSNSKQITDLGQILSSTKAELNLAIDQVTALVMNGESGNVVMRYNEQNQPYEILIMDTADINTATRVWRWNMSGLSYSASGYEGPYTSAITMDGQIVANFITTGTLSADRIAAHSLTADKLAVGTITAESGVLADLAVTTAKIALGAITSALIETGAVETAQIADGSITDAKIVSLTANKITAGTIDAANINVINLNASNLTVGTINGQQISDGAVSTEKIAASAITTEKVALGAITATLIAAEAITGDKIVASAITGDKIAASTITANNLVAGTITAVSGILADAAITTANIANAAVTDAKINSLSADKITAGTLMTATVGGKTTHVKINSTEGLAFYDGSIYRGGLAVRGGDLTLLTDIIGTPDDLYHYGKFSYHDPYMSGDPDEYFSILRFFSKVPNSASSDNFLDISGRINGTNSAQAYLSNVNGEATVDITAGGAPYETPIGSAWIQLNNSSSGNTAHIWLHAINNYEQDATIRLWSQSSPYIEFMTDMTERGRFDSNGLTVNGVGVDTPKEVSATASSTNWYTIATRSTGRAFGEFLISDSTSGKHNVSMIMASTAYGKNSVTVLHGNRYSSQSIYHARILYDSSDRVYGGAKLQIYVSSGSSIHIQMWKHRQYGWNAWTLTTPTLEGTPSGWAEDYDSRANNITDTSFKLWNQSNDGSGSGLDADLLDGYHQSSFLHTSGGSVTGDLYIGGKLGIKYSTSGASMSTNEFVCGGNARITGDLDLGAGGYIRSSSTGHIVVSAMSGAVYLRPNGDGSSWGEFRNAGSYIYALYGSMASGRYFIFDGLGTGSQGAEPTLRPSTTGGWGYIGANSDYKFYRGYCSSWVSTSALEYKENLRPFDTDEAYDLVKNMPVYAYRHKDKEDIQLGVLVEDSPLEILNVDSYGADQKSIDVYSFTAMTLAVVQKMQQKIEQLEMELASMKGVA
jgi:phage minor structural protein